jgi:hypothetical protein
MNIPRIPLIKFYVDLDEFIEKISIVTNSRCEIDCYIIGYSNSTQHLIIRFKPPFAKLNVGIICSRFYDSKYDKEYNSFRNIPVSFFLFEII